MISLLAVMSDGQGIEIATVGSEGVVGAMSGFGIRQSFTRAVVQAPLVASHISSVQFRSAVQKSEGIRNLMVSYNGSWHRFSRRRRATPSTPWNPA